MKNRLILLISMLGAVLAMHLWIQKERDFDQGCMGVAVKGLASLDGCRSPSLAKMNQMFGVSTAAVGYLFYCAMAGLTYLKMASRGPLGSWSRLLADVLVSAAAPMAIYLVYFQVKNGAYCILCLISSGFILSMFVLHALQWGRVVAVESTERTRVADIGYAAGVSLGAGGLALAILIFVNQVGVRSNDVGLDADKFDGMLKQALPGMVRSEALKATPSLPEKGPPQLNAEEWDRLGFPWMGNKAGVRVVAFFDPNCPHCELSFSSFLTLAKKYGDRASFCVVPRPLWDFSVLQVQAIDLAKNTDRYIDMWQAQFSHQKKGGLGMGEVKAIFDEIGLSVQNLDASIRGRGPAVAALQAAAVKSGVNSTPAFYIEGRLVAPRDRKNASMERLIEQALAERSERAKVSLSVSK